MADLALYWKRARRVRLRRRDASSYRGARGGGEESPEFIAEQRALQRALFDAGYAGITDLVALAREAGTEGDGRVRQEIARAHVNDYMHGQLAQRVVASIANGTLDMSGASMIKLGSGIYNPIRARIGMEIAGAAAIAWDTQDAEGNDTATT